ERRPVRGRRQARVQVAGTRADLRAGVVLLDVEIEAAEFRHDPVGDRPLLTRRRRHRRQVEEQVERVHRAAMLRQAVAAGTACRVCARSRAAPTNSRNSGAGRVGRDLNSGWNWLATNHGWSGSSTTSTSRPSWNVPDTTSPASTTCWRYALFTS